MASIFLIRHGQASFQSDNYDQLSPLGFLQARQLGMHWQSKQQRPHKIISGTLVRHQQTAAETTRILDNPATLAIQSHAAWNEFDHKNLIAAFDPAWSEPAAFRQHIKNHNQPDQFFLTEFGRCIARWLSGEFDGDYAESWTAFKRRTNDGLMQLADDLAADDIAMVFTSGGPIASIVLSLLDIPDNHLLKINQQLVNCGVTKLITSRTGIFLSSLNDHSAFDTAALKHLITYK